MIWQLVYSTVGRIQRQRETRQQVFIKVDGADEAFFASFLKIAHSAGCSVRMLSVTGSQAGVRDDLD